MRHINGLWAVAMLVSQSHFTFSGRCLIESEPCRTLQPASQLESFAPVHGNAKGQAAPKSPKVYPGGLGAGATQLAQKCTLGGAGGAGGAGGWGGP